MADFFSFAADAIKQALTTCGYNPIKIDEVQHNARIDQLVLETIRLSGLLVADVTHHRQGVYFESGFAMGIGLPVIWCCHPDQLNEAHFDTRQYNHVKWADAADLREKLGIRLQGTAPSP